MDTDPPSLTVRRPAATVVTTKAASYLLRGRAEDNISPVQLQHRLRGPDSNEYGAWQSSSLPFPRRKAKLWSQNVEFDREGSWSVQVRVLDAAGNASTPQDREFRVDRTPPSLMVTAPQQELTITKARSYTLSGAAMDNFNAAQIQYRTRPPDGSFSAWQSKALLEGESTNRSWALELGLTQTGNWRVQVRVRDDAGNLSPVATRVLVVDRARPTLSITSPEQKRAVTTAPRFMVTGEAADNLNTTAVQYRVRPPRNKRFSGWRQVALEDYWGKNKNWSQEIQTRRKGVWRIQLRGIDAAGNVSTVQRLIVVRR
jgi:hypothetical protein